MEYEQTKIEYIQDVKFYNDNDNDCINFKGFKEPISYICQSNSKGDILISSWDGNTYLFDKPIIDGYLKHDKYEENFFIQ